MAAAAMKAATDEGNPLDPLRLQEAPAGWVPAIVPKETRRSPTPPLPDPKP